MNAMGLDTCTIADSMYRFDFYGMLFLSLLQSAFGVSMVHVCTNFQGSGVTIIRTCLARLGGANVTFSKWMLNVKS